MLREALHTQQHFLGDDGWQIATTKSLLGAALLGEGRTADASGEPLLAAGSERSFEGDPGTARPRDQTDTRAGRNAQPDARGVLTEG